LQALKKLDELFSNKKDAQSLPQSGARNRSAKSSTNDGAKSGAGEAEEERPAIVLLLDELDYFMTPPKNMVQALRGGFHFSFSFVIF